jgi:3-hydroxybutyryl-CoA dehydratase
MTGTLRRQITQESINRYGELNGDNDQLHYDAEYARSRGFQGTIAHGLMLLGTVTELAVSRMGSAWFEQGYVGLKWIAPTHAGDEIVVAIDDGGKIEVHAAAGRVVALGTATSAGGGPSDQTSGSE